MYTQTWTMQNQISKRKHRGTSPSEREMKCFLFLVQVQRLTGKISTTQRHWGKEKNNLNFLCLSLWSFQCGSNISSRNRLIALCQLKLLSAFFNGDASIIVSIRTFRSIIHMKAYSTQAIQRHKRKPKRKDKKILLISFSCAYIHMVM